MKRNTAIKVVVIVIFLLLTSLSVYLYLQTSEYKVENRELKVELEENFVTPEVTPEADFPPPC